MLIQLMANCDSNEVGSVSTEINKEAQKRDWTADPFFLEMLNNLQSEATKLEYATGTVHKFSYTQELKQNDSAFDQAYLQMKHFIIANTYSQDKAIAQNAREVMNIVEAHDSNLYRLGYGKQIFLVSSLIKDLKAEKIKPMVDSLFGVSESIVALEAITNKLDATFQKSKVERSSSENILPPSEQKNIVRDLINIELIPYLLVMSKKDPDNYEEFCNLIFKYIEDANIAVKARLTRNTNQQATVTMSEEENV